MTSYLPSARCFVCFISTASEHAPFDSYAFTQPVAAAALPFVSLDKARKPEFDVAKECLQAMVLHLMDESMVAIKINYQNLLFDN